MITEVIFISGWGFELKDWFDTCATRYGFSSEVKCRYFGVENFFHAENSLTDDAFATWFSSVLPQDKEHKTLLVGWSLGGALALYMAKKNPKQIGGVVCCASNLCFVNKSDWNLGVDASVFQKRCADFAARPAETLLTYAKEMVAVGPSKSMRFRLLTQLLLQEDVVQDSLMEMLLRGLLWLQQADLRSELCQIVCPVSMIWGALDQIVPVTIKQSTQAINSNIQHIVIPEGGHDFILHNLESLAHVIREHLHLIG